MERVYNNEEMSKLVYGLNSDSAGDYLRDLNVFNMSREEAMLHLKKGHGNKGNDSKRYIHAILAAKYFLMVSQNVNGSFEDIRREVNRAGKSYNAALKIARKKGYGSGARKCKEGLRVCRMSLLERRAIGVA
jgi:hypothetical protein